MKILTSDKPNRIVKLNTTYTCELSGWEIAAITALLNTTAGGAGLRKYCDAFSNEGDKLFPFISEIQTQLFSSEGYFKANSAEILLDETN